MFNMLITNFCVNFCAQFRFKQKTEKLKTWIWRVRTCSIENFQETTNFGSTPTWPLNSASSTLPRRNANGSDHTPAIVPDPPEAMKGCVLLTLLFFQGHRFFSLFRTSDTTTGFPVFDNATMWPTKRINRLLTSNWSSGNRDFSKNHFRRFMKKPDVHAVSS